MDLASALRHLAPRPLAWCTNCNEFAIHGDRRAKHSCMSRRRRVQHRSVIPTLVLGLPRQEKEIRATLIGERTVGLRPSDCDHLAIDRESLPKSPGHLSRWRWEVRGVFPPTIALHKDIAATRRKRLPRVIG